MRSTWCQKQTLRAGDPGGNRKPRTKLLASLPDQRSWRSALYVRRQKSSRVNQNQPLGNIDFTSSGFKEQEQKLSPSWPSASQELLPPKGHPLSCTRCVQLFTVVFTATETARTEGSHVALNRRVGPNSSRVKPFAKDTTMYKPARRTAKHLQLMDRLPRGGSWAFFGARSLRDDAKTPAKRVALAG